MVTAVAGLAILLIVAPFALASSTSSYAGVLIAAPALVLTPLPTTAGEKPPVMAQVTPPPMPQPPSAQFFYSENGKPVGPVTLADIQAKIAAGTITADTLVWKAGTPGWVAARTSTPASTHFAPPPRSKPARPTSTG